MYTSESLRRMILSAEDFLQVEEFYTLAHEFKALGITPKMNVGRGSEMNGSDAGKLLFLEWFAGGLVDIMESDEKALLNQWQLHILGYRIKAL